jgi:hypothetical protein
VQEQANKTPFARLDTSHGVSARALLLQQGPSHQAHETTNTHATASFRSYVAVEKKMNREKRLRKQWRMHK